MGRNWDETEDNILRTLVKTHGKQWNLIAQSLPKRTPSQVAARWEKCLDPNIIKGPFTQEEDQMIIDYVTRNGPRGWPRITQILPHRSSKQCRERWFNHLDPNVKKMPWTPEEDNLIYTQHKTLGGKWSTIAKMLPGRTDNSIKNRWNSSISKRLQVDQNGNEYILPDSSKRQYKQKSIPHGKQLDPLPDSSQLQNQKDNTQVGQPQTTSNIQNDQKPQIQLKPQQLQQPPPQQNQPASHPRMQPPPLQIPSEINSSLNSGLNSGLALTPFTLQTSFPPTESGLFTPISPIPGFTSTPGAFGGLTSPGTSSTFGIFSPIKANQAEGEGFK
ncbi:hypothetical protein M9Y10_028928 [Tritrichomonas musculus]|uniref:Myb-like DNA-binding domain containing protein n=1 Tax=Tritrichomonas musculus TaxID=1915356 RepID=A0ABR2KLK4_9EUKA